MKEEAKQFYRDFFHSTSNDKIAEIFECFARNGMTVRDQIYTHILGRHDDPFDGDVRHFNVSRLWYWVDRGGTRVAEFFETPIDPSHVEWAFNYGGVEKDHLPNVDPDDPVLAILWDDGTTTIVDGIHRMVRGYQLGRKMMRVCRVKRPVWEQCLLVLPPHLHRFYMEMTQRQL